ncbi:MAG TPA: hypothetical protein VD713_00460, partial [Sphingomonadales bacterium]|nr:hypothetical protein [Sphingomonadales bacterium]
YPEAIRRAANAQCFMKEGTREWLQAEDVIVSSRALIRDDPRFKNYREPPENRQREGEWDITAGKPRCFADAGKMN